MKSKTDHVNNLMSGLYMFDNPANEETRIALGEEMRNVMQVSFVLTLSTSVWNVAPYSVFTVEQLYEEAG